MSINDLIIILNLLILESLLSVDNAVVMATLVSHLPENQQKKAIRWGMAGAIIFRGLCLLLASWLIGIKYLKLIGGAYLLYLCIGHFTKAKDTIYEAENSKVRGLWATIALVEITDLLFSVDNVFAAVAMSSKMWVIITGVSIGIITIRFITGGIVNLLNRYPALNNSAFIVIGILGFKLILEDLGSIFITFAPMKDLFTAHWFDLSFGLLTVLIFLTPMIFRRKKQII